MFPFISAGWLSLHWAGPFRSAYTRLTLAASLGAAYLILSTAVLGRWTHDLPDTLWFGSGIFGLFVLVFLGRGMGKSTDSWKISFSVIGMTTFAVAVILSLLVASVALRFSFHDQMIVQAHPPLIESLLRGNLPPTLMVFPEVPLKYHYGSDVFSAVFSYVTGLPGYRAIDITQIFGWIATLACLYVLCQELEFGAFHSLAALLWVPLAYGWPYLLSPWLASPQELPRLNFAWPVSYWLFNRLVNPGTVNNFFMTPYSLGLPIFFAYLTLFSRFLKGKRGMIAWILALSLAALSVIQVTFFASLLSASLFVLFIEWILKKRNGRDFLIPALILTSVSIFLGASMGGFFVRSDAYSPGLLQFHWIPGYLKNSLHGIGHPPLTAGEAFLWYLSTFGSLVFLALPFAALALVSLKKRFDPMLGFLLFYSAQCFGVAQFFSYKLTFDIIKWLTGFHISMLLLIVLLWSRCKTRKIALSLALSSFLILDIIPSLRFLPSLAYLRMDQVHPINRGWWRAIIADPSADLQPLLRAFRGSSWKEIVLTTPDLSPVLSRYSGQAMAYPDRNTELFGIKPEILDARNQLILDLQKTFNLEILRSSPIRWIAFPCGDFERAFSEESKSALNTAVGSGELLDLSYTATQRCWKVYHLKKLVPPK